MSDPAGHDNPFTLNPADGQAGTNDSETTEKSTHPGHASETVADAGGVTGELRHSPEVGEAEEAASAQSRKIAEAEGTET